MAQITKIFLLVALIATNLHAKILLEKDGIIINSLDLEIFLNNEYPNIVQTSNQAQSLKQIFLIKKTLKKIREKNPNFINTLDKKLKLESKEINYFSDELLRYSEIKGDLIQDYFINKLTFEDVTNTINLSGEILLPLSKNKCLTINKFIEIKQIKDFDKKYYEKIKNPYYSINYKINSNNYEICIDSLVSRKIEVALINIIGRKIEKDFYKYIYEK